MVSGLWISITTFAKISAQGGCPTAALEANDTARKVLPRSRSPNAGSTGSASHRTAQPSLRQTVGMFWTFSASQRFWAPEMSLQCAGVGVELPVRSGLGANRDIAPLSRRISAARLALFGHPLLPPIRGT